jgi:protoporphyrinogen oxidase
VRVAVIGAGVTGLVAAYRLGQAGHACDVYERWPGLGGQAATIDVGDGVLLERYYHHWFTSDHHIADLCHELDVGVEWRRSSMSFFVDGRLHPFTSPLDLLRFRPLRPWSRLRMGLAVVALQRRPRNLSDYEGETAKSWIERNMGRPAWDKVWGPLLRGKFGTRAEEISMAWLWSKLTVRRQIKGKEAREEYVGYPAESFEQIYAELQRRIEAAGGRVLIDCPAVSIGREGTGFRVRAGEPQSFRKGHDPRAYVAAGSEHYDAVVATVPSPIFTQLLEPELTRELAQGYLERVGSAEYHTALCLLLELDRSFTSYYWTNVADRRLPFVGLVEQTNLVEPERYGGRRFLYVANYVEPGHELLSLSLDELLARYEPGLRAVNPDFSREWVRNAWLFREAAAQPIVTLGYHERIPPLDTGVPGLVLANTMQIYPEDRGTNYSVRLAEDAVAVLMEQARGHVAELEHAATAPA